MLLHPRTIDLTGMKIGRWNVVRFVEYRQIKDRKFPIWECKCECGTTKEVRAVSILSGASLSCGCIQKEAAAKQGKVMLKFMVIPA